MQSRKLDRQARPFVNAAPGGSRPDRVQRVRIGGEIARRVLRGGRRFAEHVVGIAKPVRLVSAGGVNRRLDGLAANELLTHHPHRRIDAGADDRRAASRDQSRQRRTQTALIESSDQPPRDDKAPGRRIDERRRRLAEMGAPFAAADLAGDQRVARRAVGNAQERFGEAHQGDALLAGKRIFAHQALHQTRRRARAQALDELARQRLRRGLGRGGKRRRPQQRGQTFRLRRAIGRVDRRAQAVVALDIGQESRKGLFLDETSAGRAFDRGDRLFGH